MKKSLIFILLLASFASGQSINDGLVAYYPFNGNLKDSTGHGYNATLESPLSTQHYAADRFFTPNSCYQEYTGSPAIFANGIYNYKNFKNGISFSFWVNSSWTGTVLWSDYFTFGADNEAQNITTNFNSNDPVNKWTWFKPLLDGYWNHIVATCDGTNAYIYINGFFAKSFHATMSLDSSGSLLVMCSPYRGFIDDVRIYNRVLSKSDVTALFGNYSGIETVSIPNISIYPNPTKGIIHVSEPCDIKIYNLSGQLVKSCLNEQVIDVSGLKGLYMIEMRNKEGVKVEKVNLY